MIATNSTDQDKPYQGLPSKTRVMIVDDQSTTRNILKRVIKNSGHDVITADSGEQALQLLDESQFTLVLLDIVMPKMDGFEVLKEIRQRYSMSALPVIMVSVRDGSDDILKAFSMGANDYVAKPIDLPVICARIEAHLAYQQFNENNDFARRKLERNVAKKQSKLLTKNKVIEFEKEKRKKAEQLFHESESYFQSLIENVNDIIAVFEEDGTVVYESSSLERILGYKPEERIGKNVFELVHPEDMEVVVARFAQAFSEPEVTFSETARFLHKDGSWRLLEAIGSTTLSHEGKQRGIVNARDVTERSNLSEQLSHQASHDTLTGLINRHEFERRLQHALEACRVEQSESALFYLDLDQFKVINDNCGHIAGDELLKQISALLREKVWKRDTLARLGGDEFVVLLERCTSEQAKKVGNKILNLIDEYRFIWEDQSFTISVSIGLVPIDENSKNSVEIMKQADSACFAAKGAGRNRVHTFHDDDKTLTMLHGEMQWVAQINQAIDNDRFCLFAQPIVAVGSHDQNHGEHYELLLRMRGDENQFISPGLFLPAAERYNLSQRLDRWVIDNAFKWLMNNPNHLENLSKCAINLSGLSLGNEKFLANLVKRFEESNIPPEKICFEVTETATIANLSDARKFIETLRELGCLFALDDFGSGLSSFAYLKSLPVDYLKIDGIFVKDIDTNPINFAMVKSINEIGKVMGKKTIAEFVENAEIMKKLEEIGVDYAQGYYIDKPKPID
jgi:diguanylate cyclase (GGDEF)-like protein/PAS domain S-box-containing protein